MAAKHPSLAAPSTFATAGLLIVTSSHCSSSLPGTVATTSTLATLISSMPCLSLYRLSLSLSSVPCHLLFLFSFISCLSLNLGSQRSYVNSCHCHHDVPASQTSKQTVHALLPSTTTFVILATHLHDVGGELFHVLEDLTFHPELPEPFFFF